MTQSEFDTFGQWLSARMIRVPLSPSDLNSYLRSSDDSYIKRVCENETRLQMKDWPATATFVQLRFDELLIVIEHYHPEWVMEYDLFISNCMRYLLWRVDQNEDKTHTWIENLLSFSLEEIIEPACTGRFEWPNDRRKFNRRNMTTPPAKDKRDRPRRLRDLVHYLKNQLNVIPCLPLVVSGLFMAQGWSLQ